MNILFVAKRYYTNRDLIDDRFGRLFHLPLNLARAGHKVCVAALDYKTFERNGLSIDGLEVVSLPSRSRGFKLPVREFAEIPAAISPDLVVGSGHLHIGNTALKYAKNKEAKFIFEAYDYYPAFLPSFLHSAGERWFTSICSNADGCVAASRKLGDLMSTWNESTTVIENGFEADTFEKRNKAESLSRLGLAADKEYLCFIGSASEALGYGDFLAALDKVRQINPAVIGLHAGSFNSASRKSSDVINMGLCTQDQVVDILSVSSCGVVPYRESLQVQYSNSCKLVEYMATGLPTVATRSGDNSRVLGETGGLLVEPANPDQLADAMLKQLDHPIIPPYPEKWEWSRLAEGLEAFLAGVAS